MNCSIVIRAYNESKHIGRLLEGIQHQTIKDVEIILVDSGSSDSTVSIAESFGARIVRIPSDEFTFGRSLNFGVQAATREFIVIASAHVYPVYPDWLECLLRPFEDESVAVVYGKQRGTDASKFSEQQIFHQWFPDVDAANQAGPFCNNANAAVRKSLWDEHAYDETLTGLEDVEWARWAQGREYRVVYSAHAEIIHVHNETPHGVFNRYRREAMAFKRIFPEAHFNIYDFARLTVTNILNDLVQASRQRVLMKNFASIFWFRWYQFWGTYQGYRHSSAVTQQLRQTFYYPHWSPRGQGGRDVEPIRYNK
ncbi:MAG: glycosyltransferase family 2 protein [Chloroflexi bacterium]|nr:glycosyltransferase family 2 protein [Chloroflexota bacterium]